MADDQTSVLHTTPGSPLFNVAPFLAAIARAEEPPSRRTRAWQRDAAWAAFGGTCAYCSSPLDDASPNAWLLTALVPVEFGGPPQLSENWVPSCRRCAAAKGLRDVVNWTEWQGSADPGRVALLLEHRTTTLLHSENHFTPLSKHAKRERVRAWLADRFRKPRFRVHAWSGWMDGDRVCLIGWGVRAGDPLSTSEALLSLRLRDGAEVLAQGQGTLLRLPVTGFYAAVWSLIEAHGLVIPMTAAKNDPMGTDDWRECWRHRAHDLASNHRRVPVHGGAPVPSAPRVLSSNPDSVRRLARLQAAKHVESLEYLERSYRAAVAQKTDHPAKVKRGLAPPLPLSEYRRWSDDVRALGAKWATASR